MHIYRICCALYLENASWLIGIVEVQIIDVAGHRNGEDVVVLPQGGDLHVLHRRAHFEFPTKKGLHSEIDG